MRCPVDGASASPIARASPRPPAVPGAVVDRLLGSGGFGVVWSGRLADRSVAIKVAHDGAELTIARLAHEALALAELGAPIAPALIWQGCLDDGRPALAMELLDGEDLARFAERAPMLPHDIHAIARELARAIAALHDRGWTHRDLKPDNVVRARDGCRLLDFGLAGRIGDVARAVGSIEYAAPEQFGGGGDARSDIYAWGAIVYELLTARPPFVGDSAAIEHGHVNLRPPRLSELACVPAPIEDLVLACLAKQPERRPAARELVDAIARAWTSTDHRAARRSAARSLLVERTQPVVVLAVRGVAIDAIEASVARRGGCVARRHGELAVCVIPPATDAARDAHAAARELAGLGADVAVHVGRLELRRRRSGAILVTGDEVDAPACWIPEAWSGLVITDAVKRVLPPDHEGPCLGRDSELSRVAVAVDACAETRRPGLVAITGGPGVGKTRLAAELARTIEGVSSIAAGLDRDRDDERVRAALGADNRMMIVDDAHRLDPRTLDAIEQATLARDRALCIVLLGDPRLLELRPALGTRAHRYDHLSLVPLGPDTARLLAEQLLAPADYLPRALFDRIFAMSSGIPELIVRVIAELVRRGAIKRRERGAGWEVAAHALDAIDTATTSAWLAHGELEALPPELAACTRVCAVLGPSFHAAELAAVIEAADRSGVSSSTMDVGVALQTLADRGVLIADADWYGFASEHRCDAIYSLLGDRDRRALHALAVTHWATARDGGLLAQAQLARHLEGSGNVEAAADAYAVLGDRARADHRYVDAERHYSAALRCGTSARVQARALAGRGVVRADLHHTGDALVDLREARRLGERLTDVQLIASILLDEAIAADAAGDYTAAEAAAAKALELVARLGDPALLARARLAEGRSAWRRGELAAAIPLLSEAAQRGEQTGDATTAIVAEVLLGPALVLAGQLDEAEQMFDRALARCRATGDRLHECAVYGNRLYLWSARHSADRAIEDLRTAIEIAREIGNPEPERVATHNLAELLLWQGELDEALELALRARLLQERFWKALPDDALLLARIRAARGELAEARALLDWIRDACDLRDAGPIVRALVEVLVAFVGDDRASWDRVRDVTLPPEETLEVAALAAKWHATA